MKTHAVPHVSIASAVVTTTVIEQRDILNLAHEYETLMSENNTWDKGRLQTVLSLTRHILDATIYKHPEEHELPEPEETVWADDLVPIGEIPRLTKIKFIDDRVATQGQTVFAKIIAQLRSSDYNRTLIELTGGRQVYMNPSFMVLPEKSERLPHGEIPDDLIP